MFEQSQMYNVINVQTTTLFSFKSNKTTYSILKTLGANIKSETEAME